jgi:uncharacterized protein YceK
MRSSDNARTGSPKVYPGTRLDLAALQNDQDSLSMYHRYGISAPTYPAVDLPLSFVGDTVMLPFALWYAFTEPFVGRD